MTEQAGDVIALRVTTELAEECRRVVEILPEQTLADLHKVIAEEFRLEVGREYAFYTSGEPWDEETEVLGEGGSHGAADEAVLSALALQEGQSICYLWDLDNEVEHTVEVLAGRPRVAGRVYPFVAEREGIPPDVDAPPDEEGLFDDRIRMPEEPFDEAFLDALVKALDEWDAEDQAAAMKDPRKRARYFRIADEVRTQCPEPDRFDELEWALDRDVLTFLIDLSLGLKEGGDAQRAEALEKYIEPLADYEMDEGEEEIDEGECGDEAGEYGDEAAEGEEEGDDELDAETKRKLDLLEDMAGALDENVDDEPQVPYRRETPKVGRNDPCPCGSGKKYKKCCGR